MNPASLETPGCVTLRRAVRIERPAAVVFAWHEQPGAFDRMAPPWATMTRRSATGGIRNGARVELRQHVGPLRLRWEVEHSDFVENVQFRDVASRSPFQVWEHLHRVEPISDEACLWVDEVRYRLPGGPLGRWLLGGRVRSELDRLFTYRHAVLKADLEQPLTPPPQRILLAGASGLLGRGLAAFLSTQGHDVLRLVRHPARQPDELQWNPNVAELEHGPLDGIDTVINLSGANIADRNWSDRRRDTIIHSRKMATSTLVNAFKDMPCRPKLFLSASAVGFYGDRGDTLLDEEADTGDNFLALICRTWEEEARRAESLGIRTVMLRTGVVLTPEGGALKKMLPLFQLGLGGRIGDGRAWMSWITPDDYAGAIQHAIATPSMRGPYNLVAPEPVRNADFARTLASVLSRPGFLPTPAWVLRTVFGQMAEETVLASQRAVPRRLLEAGYDFRHPDLETALRHVLGRSPAAALPSSP
jgi:uncharacterized protein (TIGR01777 family)